VNSKIPASVSIVAFNQEALIRACLESVRDFDETVLVLDSRTTDRTAEIAESYGCRIFIEPWKGYGPQKQSAIEKCRNDWVLILDSDEKLPAETVAEIARALRKPDAAAYTMPRKNFLHGRWLRHSDYWPDWQTRLVNRKFGKLSTNAVHDRWVLMDGFSAKTLMAPMEHYSFTSYEDMIGKMNRYSSFIARDLSANGRFANVSPTTSLIHGLWMFFKIYVMKKGFLDGFDGLVTALLKAGGSFFKYAKLLEMKRERGLSLSLRETAPHNESQGIGHHLRIGEIENPGEEIMEEHCETR